MITAIKIIILLGFLVLIHEMGHYIAAKICKIRVNEFAIGFGPKIFNKKGKETEYELRLIPLGGFVNLEGEDEESSKEGSFSKANIPKRIFVVAAGALVNILFGIIAYFCLILIRYLIIINGNFLEAINYAFLASAELIQNMWLSIVELFSGNVGLNDMVGPIGISNMVSKTSGLTEFIYLLSIISVSLGITNLLPIIPLDGGKIVLLIIEGIRKKPLNKDLEIKIQSIAFLVLIIFSIVVAFNDVARIV